MQLDNIEEMKILLLEIENLFVDLDSRKKELEQEILLKEAEQEDYLYELELANLNGIEIMKVANSLRKTRKERRVLKNKLEIIKTMKGYTDKYITIGIITDTKQAIKNIETLKIIRKERNIPLKLLKI